MNLDNMNYSKRQKKSFLLILYSKTHKIYNMILWVLLFESEYIIKIEAVKIIKNHNCEICVPIT